MATLRERDVFEYCENLFEKLKKEDGGYYPHKHDRLVFEKTAEHFSISDENVRKIYDSYTKLAAQMEMLKIRRLPKKKQQAAMMRKMQDTRLIVLQISQQVQLPCLLNHGRVKLHIGSVASQWVKSPP